VAKSSWKYHFYKKSDIECYIDYITDTQNNSYNSCRNTTLTKLNSFKPSILYSGKYTFERFFTKYHIGFKLGSFTKTRKPFYFRSKKKKNVTKKYQL
jgi:ribosomal protein S19